MKEIIIIGAGGFGKEIYSYIQDDLQKGYLKNIKIKGFIDDNKNIDVIDSLYLGNIDEYIYRKEDYIIVAIANVFIRNRIINKLKNKNVNFYKYIHHSAFISLDAKIEKGTIICPHSIIQTNTHIKEFSILNIFSSIGHDSVLGKNSILSPYSSLNGNVKTGDNLFMGTRATILLGSSLGSNCTISAHTVVKGKIGDNYMFKDKITQIKIKNRLI
jgi:sugar O-acyltransferase (sialic acid O-acetyltransferase NeuD family)